LKWDGAGIACVGYPPPQTRGTLDRVKGILTQVTVRQLKGRLGRPRRSTMRAMNGYRQIAQPLLERFRNLHENPETERSQRFSDWRTFPDLTIREGRRLHAEAVIVSAVYRANQAPAAVIGERLAGIQIFVAEVFIPASTKVVSSRARSKVKQSPRDPAKLSGEVAAG
jgi:hypothetical protein